MSLGRVKKTHYDLLFAQRRKSGETSIKLNAYVSKKDPLYWKIVNALAHEAQTELIEMGSAHATFVFQAIHQVGASCFRLLELASDGTDTEKIDTLMRILMSDPEQGAAPADVIRAELAARAAIARAREKKK